MRFPFMDELDDLFRQDRSIWWKMLGGAVAAAVAVTFAVVRGLRQQRGEPEFGLATIAIAIAIAAPVGALAAVLLSLKDVVRRRLKSGRRVNWLLRIYFGAGVVSLAVWVVTLFVLSMVGIIVVFGFFGV